MRTSDRENVSLGRPDRVVAIFKRAAALEWNEQPCPSSSRRPEAINQGSGDRSDLPKAGSFRELLAVAVPLVLSSGSISLMIAIDRLFLTWYSEDALAACTPAAALHWTVMSAFVGTINYTNAFVAQYEGAGRKDRVMASVWQAIFLAILAGFVFLGLVPFASAVFNAVGHAPNVRRLETQFFQTLCFGAVPMLLTMALGAFYSGRGKTRVVMYVDFLLAATNICLDPMLIFGLGPFPRLGIVGAALSTDIAYTVAVGAYLVLSLRSADCIAYGFWKHVRIDKELVGRLLRYGLPTGLQMAVELSAFSVFLFLVGRLGTAELAATNLAFNINMLSFIPMMGVGMAVMTLVGKRIGEGRPALAVRTTWLAARSVATYMLVFCILFVVFPRDDLAPVYRLARRQRHVGNPRYGDRAAAVCRLLHVLRRDANRVRIRHPRGGRHAIPVCGTRCRPLGP